MSSEQQPIISSVPVPSIPEPSIRDLQGAIGDQPQNMNNLRQTQFRFQIDRLPHVEFFCIGVALPGLNIGVIEQPTAGFVTIPQPGNVAFEDLTVNFNIDEGFRNYVELFKWMREITNFRDTNYYDRSKIFSDAILYITNSNKKSKIKVTFKDMWPSALNGMSFERTASSSEPLNTNAIFRFTSYEIECV